uniref:Tripartite motif containing 35 n=1 Tax=Otus sunia TaxID=257818 RepID=A0A8C8EEB3_9STRI
MKQPRCQGGSQRSPCLIITQCHPVPPGTAVCPAERGQPSPCVSWARSILCRVGLDPAVLVPAGAGYCSNASGLGADLGWGLHNSPSWGGTWDGETALSPVGMGHGYVGRRRRRRCVPAGSWASCQDLPCFLVGKTAAAALTQPMEDEPGFKCRGAKLKNMETSLRDKVKDFGAVHRSYESISKHNQVEATRLEEQIRREFEKLHEFLRDEEKALLAQLQDEMRRKHGLIEGKMKQLAEESRALLNEASQLRADLKEDDYTFLMTHKNRKRRIACTAEEPEAVSSGMLLNVAKYLGSLQYNVWKKMLDIITVVPFSFDPNSAANWLSVSEDLTSVTNGGYKLLVENPERFTSAPCILGSRGFSTGFHTWEVDLGGITNWRVGVAQPRGGTHWTFHHDARSGFWYIYRLPGKDGEMCRASNTARSEAALGDLRRIRVELDCDEGELSFYNADSKSHIYTFHENFGGTVFPYFYVGAAPAGALPEALRICPLQVRIHEDVPA